MSNDIQPAIVGKLRLYPVVQRELFQDQLQPVYPQLLRSRLYRPQRGTYALHPFLQVFCHVPHHFACLFCVLFHDQPDGLELYYAASQRMPDLVVDLLRQRVPFLDLRQVPQLLSIFAPRAQSRRKVVCPVPQFLVGLLQDAKVMGVFFRKEEHKQAHQACQHIFRQHAGLYAQKGRNSGKNRQGFPVVSVCGYDLVNVGRHEEQERSGRKCRRNRKDSH